MEDIIQTGTTVNDPRKEVKHNYGAQDTENSLLNGKEPLYRGAISLLNRGYSVGITSSSKRPIGPWQKFQNSPASEEEIIDQLAHPDAHGLCIFTGYNAIEVIDVDLKYDLSGTLYERLTGEISRQLPGLIEKLAIIKTISGGYHLIYKCETIDKNQKLANRFTTEDEKNINPDEKQKSLIETRGIGGLVVTAPTPGYVSVQRNEPPLISIEERETLLNICRSFNEVYKEVTNDHQPNNKTDVFELTPWDDYNQRGDIVALLEKHNWKIDSKFGSKVRFTRPGKNKDTSAEWDSQKGKFYVWTTSSQFVSEHGYTPSSVFKVLECNNDASEMSRQLESLGYGIRRVKSDPKKSQAAATIEIDSLIEWLHKNYRLKRNEINRRIELNGAEIQQKDFNSIYLAAKKMFSKLNYDLLERTINSDYTPTYNPLKDFIEANKDRKPEGNFKALSQTIKTDTGFDGNEFFPDYVFHFVLKWYVGIIASIYGEHSPLMLVLCGNKQGTGKTEWLRRLLPAALKSFYGESKLDAGKDDEILMTQLLLISDDEFGGKSKKNEKLIKELLSKDYFTLREPYGRHNVSLKRLAVLCGTTNDSEILSDPTGNRRIIPINVLEIDKEAYNKIDKTDLFIEAYHLYKNGFDWRLNSDDIRDLNHNTTGFEQTSIERDLLAENFGVPLSENDPAAIFMTTSKVKAVIELRTHQRLNMNRLGIEIRKMTGKEDRIARRINGQSIKGYLLIDKLNDVVSSH